MKHEELKAAVTIIDNTKKRKSPNKSFVYKKRQEKRNKKDFSNEDNTWSSDAAQTSNSFAPTSAEDEQVQVYYRERI